MLGESVNGGPLQGGNGLAAINDLGRIDFDCFVGQIRFVKSVADYRDTVVVSPDIRALRGLLNRV